MADKTKGGDLLDRVTGVRRTFASEMGLLVPPIRLRDNLQLGNNEYRFVLKGNPIAKSQLMPGHWLAMNATNSKVALKGVPTVEPVFQLPATWVTDVERKNAEVSGFTVVDAPSVLVTHLSETVRRHCHEILTRQDVQALLDNLKQTHPAVVNELIPGQLISRPGAAHFAESAGRGHFHPQSGGHFGKSGRLCGIYEESR